jgi:hypothetical protein
MTKLGGLSVALAALLAVAGPAAAGNGDGVQLAWQMETIEPGQGQGITGGDPTLPGFGGGGSGVGSGPQIRVEPVQPRARGPFLDDDTRRPTVFGEGRPPFYRPGSGRNCSGEGAGRVCF